MTSFLAGVYSACKRSIANTIAFIAALPTNLSLNSTYNRPIFPVAAWNSLFLFPTITWDNFSHGAGLALARVANISACVLRIPARQGLATNYATGNACNRIWRCHGRATDRRDLTSTPTAFPDSNSARWAGTRMAGKRTAVATSRNTYAGAGIRTAVRGDEASRGWIYDTMTKTPVAGWYGFTFGLTAGTSPFASTFLATGAPCILKVLDAFGSPSPNALQVECSPTALEIFGGI